MTRMVVQKQNSSKPPCLYSRSYSRQCRIMTNVKVLSGDKVARIPVELFGLRLHCKKFREICVVLTVMKKKQTQSHEQKKLSSNGNKFIFNVSKLVM